MINKLNIADYFSLYRFIAVPIIIICIIHEKKILTSGLLAIRFITDALDGYIARKKDIATSRGAKLDSLGDLLTVLVGLVAFVSFETDYFKDHLPIIITTFSLFIFSNNTFFYPI